MMLRYNTRKQPMISISVVVYYYACPPSHDRISAEWATSYFGGGGLEVRSIHLRSDQNVMYKKSDSVLNLRIPSKPLAGSKRSVNTSASLFDSGPFVCAT